MKKENMFSINNKIFCSVCNKYFMYEEFRQDMIGHYKNVFTNKESEDVIS